MNTNTNKFSKRVWRTGGVLGAAVLALGIIGLLPAAVAAESKAIQVRDQRKTGDLRIAFDPLKSSYRVNEPIRFRVRGNQQFYLYLYTINDATGEAVLLLPNKRQQGNKYPSRRSLVVPNKSVEFYSDSPGRERIIMVASTRYIDIDTARFKPVGDFAKTSTKGLEDAFASKGIRIRDNRTKPQSDVLVHELDVRITGSRYNLVDDRPAGGDRQGDAGAVTFVSTAKNRYREGEKVRVVFGANKSGWVHLYTIEPGGGYSLLKRQKVDGKEVNQVTARAEAPYGPHTLVAAFSKGKDFDAAILDEYDSDRRDKALTLIAPRPVAIAVQRIWVRR